MNYFFWQNNLCHFPQIAFIVLLAARTSQRKRNLFPAQYTRAMFAGFARAHSALPPPTPTWNDKTSGCRGSWLLSLPFRSSRHFHVSSLSIRSMTKLRVTSATQGIPCGPAWHNSCANCRSPRSSLTLAVEMENTCKSILGV